MGYIFLFFWISIQIFWYYLLKFSSVDIKEISIPSILMAFIYMFSFVGFPILWFGLDPYRELVITDKNILYELFMYTVFAITFLIFGFILGRQFFGSLNISEYFQRDKVELGDNHNFLTFLFCVLFIFCIAILFLYISVIGFNNLAFIAAIEFVSSDISTTELRSSSTNALGNYRWYKLFMNDLLLFCSFFFFASALLKRKFFLWFLSISSILIVSFALIMSGEKGPITQILIGIFLTYYLTQKEGKINFKIIAIFAFIGFLILVPVDYLLQPTSETLLESSSSVISRVVTGQIHPMYVYFEYFPYYRDYLMGATFPNPGSVFPFEPVTITREIMAWYNPKEAESGVIGTMPAIFWIEAYINFGPYFFLAVSVFIGIGVFLINKIILLFKPNPLVISFFVWLILFYKDLAVSFFSDQFLNLYLYAIISIFMVFYLIVNKGRLIVTK